MYAWSKFNGPYTLPRRYDSAVEAAWVLTLFILGSLLLTVLYEAQTKELLMCE